MKNIILLILLLSSLSIVAQNSNPVSWTFSGKKGANPNEYIVTATAKIQNGFHVFAPNPGGDGMLIPTEMNIINKEIFKSIGPLSPQRKPITKEMKGIGMVNYYEGEIDFNITLIAENPKVVKGMITSQACNDEMCFPPSDVEFSIKL